MCCLANCRHQLLSSLCCLDDGATLARLKQLAILSGTHENSTDLHEQEYVHQLIHPHHAVTFIHVPCMSLTTSHAVSVWRLWYRIEFKALYTYKPELGLIKDESTNLWIALCHHSSCLTAEVHDYRFNSGTW